MKVAGVIGMNYGDEGKGHITNFLSDENTLNVRFNGGGQAAHSVNLSNNLSHIFHHFGSGSLKGARTLFASHFIVNPIIFAKELWELSSKIPMSEVFSDPRCRVSTPYDMMLNEFSSNYRKKNDTCGVGINETVERSSFHQLKISMRNMSDMSDSDLSSILKMIEYEYIPFRLEELKIPYEDFKNSYKDRLGKDSIIKSFLELRKWMFDKIVIVWPDDSVIEKFLSKGSKRKVVFEGAQGMLLDQRRKEYYPYLTRSNTGVDNILEVLSTISYKIELEIFLVTRSYLTRHGDGPIFNEHTKPFSNINNETNPYNKYQGDMRYGYLNLDWYKNAIEETVGKIEKSKLKNLTYSVNTAMTCLDHIEGNMKYSLDNDLIESDNLDCFENLSIISKGKFDNNIKSL